eukprot:Opistho-1_new@22828
MCCSSFALARSFLRSDRQRSPGAAVGSVAKGASDLMRLSDRSICARLGTAAPIIRTIMRTVSASLRSMRAPWILLKTRERSSVLFSMSYLLPRKFRSLSSNDSPASDGAPLRVARSSISLIGSTRLSACTDPSSAIATAAAAVLTVRMTALSSFVFRMFVTSTGCERSPTTCVDTASADSPSAPEISTRNSLPCFPPAGFLPEAPPRFPLAPPPRFVPEDPITLRTTTSRPREESEADPRMARPEAPPSRDAIMPAPPTGLTLGTNERVDCSLAPISTSPSALTPPSDLRPPRVDGAPLRPRGPPGPLDPFARHATLVRSPMSAAAPRGRRSTVRERGSLSIYSGGFGVEGMRLRPLRNRRDSKMHALARTAQGRK